MKETVCARLDQFVQEPRVFSVVSFGFAACLQTLRAADGPEARYTEGFLAKFKNDVRRVASAYDVRRKEGRLRRQCHEQTATGQSSGHVALDRDATALCDT